MKELVEKINAAWAVFAENADKQLAGNKVQIEIDKQSMKKAQKAIEDVFAPLKKWFK